MSGDPIDLRVRSTALHLIPVATRVPLKFGRETLTHVTCARVRLTAEDRRTGRIVEGWGETPLSVQWVWPSTTLDFKERHDALVQFTASLCRPWVALDLHGHALEIGHDFIHHHLPGLAETHPTTGPPIPWLAALVCCSAFDLALHDACGRLVDLPVWQTYRPPFLQRDLSAWLDSSDDHEPGFAGRYPHDFLRPGRLDRLPAWHLVGGLDLLNAEEQSGHEPDDGFPVLLSDWIQQDGLRCLKIKLRGNDPEWDFERICAVGEIAVRHGVDWLTTDFNCTVTDPAYVNELLDRLRDQHPRLYGMILYVEQPFPYELEQHPIPVHSVSARKPLFLDESAHDWRYVRLGRRLGWTGVALKTCKTQSGAVLSACWAAAHGMGLMVQDLTNPMLAQIPHLLLAAHVPTIMGVETNGMQFYPRASDPEAVVHPGIYRRRNGCIDLNTVHGPGFGYRLDEIDRPLPQPIAGWEG